MSEVPLYSERLPPLSPQEVPATPEKKNCFFVTQHDRGNRPRLSALRPEPQALISKPSTSLRRMS